MAMQLATRLLWTRRLAVTTVAMTFVLMLLGAWVKANGAGLSCPDWPTCYGEWLPPFPSADNGGTYEGKPVPYTQDLILYEWVHRGFASLLGIPLVAFAILTLRGAEFSKALRYLPTAALLTVGLQAGIGGGTVITGNPPWFTTLHLATATIIFGLLVAAAMVAHLQPLGVKAPAAETPVSKPRKVSYVYEEPRAEPKAETVEADA